MKVAILWHMHQPTYWDPQVGKYRYPWAFLHGARHYHMMALLAKEYPETAMTINVTPVLMDQLDDYSQPQFEDQLLASVIKPLDALESDELARLLDHAFKLNFSTMIAPYPRYRELKNLLDGASPRRARAQEILDLQVWYLLTWTGPHLRRLPEIDELFRKGKEFTEEDKQVVFQVCHQAVREVLPLYRELQEKGKVEISTTPYYHPILPLLVDCEIARESKPWVPLDEVSFRFPEDARWHVDEAVRAYEKRFGRRPAGMWPAEGSVSDDALELLCAAGMRWAATDEAVLARSLGQFPLSDVDKHRAYKFRDGRLVLFFRDRELSDRVGFVYSSWEPAKAVDDVVGRLLSIRERLGSHERTACVSIILDGENPWEHYRDTGVGFLTGLYRALATTPGLEAVRMGDEALELSSTSAGNSSARSLEHVVPGSWIDANFDTWIGVPEKNRAWMLLSTARKKLAVEAPGAEVPHEFYRAEGSDWFWWLGPGHDTPYEASYEDLFRRNLIDGLAKVNLQPPSIFKTAVRVISTPLLQPPTHLFTPAIDGELGNYYEWIAAGFLRASEGSIHRSSRILTLIRFGFDERALYVRAEGAMETFNGMENPSLVLEFLRPSRLKIVYKEGKIEILEMPSAYGENSNHEERSSPQKARQGPSVVLSKPSQGLAAIGTVVEAGLPLEELGAKPGDVLEFAVSLEAGGEIVDRLPQSGFVSAIVPGPDLGNANWSV